MGRNRIVYQRLDAMFLQKRLQLVATLTEDGEQVIDVVFVGKALGKGNQGIRDMFIIVGSQLLTLPVVLIQIFQLHIEHGGIYFRHAAVHTYILEHIFLLTPVIGQSPDGCCQFCIVRGNGTGITKCAQVLSRIETMCRCITKRTGSRRVKSEE